MSDRIEDYALIGDCETAALVHRNGSIDWLCWPRFDSQACFAALLGTPEHGHWRIGPRDRETGRSRRYRDGTLILETTVECETGAVLVIDFMPPRQANSDVVRLVRGLRGAVAMESELRLRFDYGAQAPWVTETEDGSDGLLLVSGPESVTLRASVPVTVDEALTSVFTVTEGETVWFTLTHRPSHLGEPQAIDAERALEETVALATAWSSRAKAGPQWSDAVVRSLLTLKALIYRPTGGIVAAPTTSLPEAIGGERNWDYRFCWLRDATLTLLALMNAGYREEAIAWREWLMRAVAGNPTQMQIMYGLAGERRLIEWEADWLPGYAGSKPVRIGNGAHGQMQLDVYGEVIDALHQAAATGIDGMERSWPLQRAILEHLEQIWTEPDEGIWEVRGEPRHFTYSKAMVWVAFDRAIQNVERFGVEGPVEHWKALRRRIHDEICDKGWDAELGSFVQSYGAKELDASLLLLPVIGFLPPDDPRIVGTVAAVEKRLIKGGLVMRYDTQSGGDGLSGTEGAFLACSFWLVDAYVLVGRGADAWALFERLLALRNDVGLLSEEYDPVGQRQVGNFPQAFSHIALINSARNLNGVPKPSEQRAEGSGIDEAA